MRGRVLVLLLEAAGACVVGGVVGWFVFGPRFVRAWVQDSEPGSYSHPDDQFARAASMLFGSVVGAVAVLALAAIGLTALQLIRQADSEHA